MRLKKMAPTPKPPILPRDPADPQGTDTLDAQAAREFKRRLRECGKAYIDALEQIPSEIATNAKTYRYQLDQGLLQWLLGNAGALVDSVMLDGGLDALWFFDGYVAVATKRGIAQQMRNIAAQSPAYKAARGSVILSEPHLQRMLLLRTRVFEDMKGFTQQIKTDLSRILADGMGRGQGPLVVAQNIKEQLKIEQHRAERIARTEISTSLRRAKWDEAEDAAAEYGSRTLEMHFSALSATSRRTHVERHGKLFSRNECRAWWAQGATAINCYLPGTEVAGRFVAGSKAFYSGPAVKIVTASGRNISVTANHPILTGRGWVLAHEITERDNLFAHSVKVENSIGVANLNIDQVYTPIEEVYRSIAQLGHSLSTRVHAIDFHGDGACMNENISVVHADRILHFSADPSLVQLFEYLSLEHSDPSVTHSGGSVLSKFATVGLPSASIMRETRAKLSEFLSEPSVAQYCSFRHSSPSQPALGKLPIDLRAGDVVFPTKLLHSLPVEMFAMHGEKVELITECGTTNTTQLQESINGHAADTTSSPDNLHGITSEIFSDDVVGVFKFNFTGHVFDLQECSGVMIANGLIASNCKCSTITTVVDENGEPVATGVVSRARAVKAKMEQRGYAWGKED